jgi:hypothetical protein
MVEEEIEAGILYDVPHPDPHVFNLWLAVRKEQACPPGNSSSG